MARARPRRLWLGLVIGAVLLGGLAAAASVARQPAATDQATERLAQPVRVVPITFAAVEQVARYTGTIRPRHEAGLGFRLAGKIVARMAEVGDRVVKGQVIAQLDDTDARLERDAALAEAEAARVDLVRAEAEAIRSRALFASGHVAQAVLDRAASGAAEARSRADRAQRALALAENRLGYTALVADADGVVTATPAEAGQVVGAGQAVVYVAETDALDVVFAVPEQDRAQVTTATAQAELWGAEGPSYALTLRDIAPDADPVGRTYRVRMALVGPDAAAALGRTVMVRLVMGRDAPAARVPLAALQNDGTGATLWRLTAARDRVEAVSVTLVDVDGSQARVRGDLRDGDMVIGLGAQKIDPARPVRVVETAPLPES